MLSFGLILALAMLVSCLNGLDTSCGQSDHDDRVFNKLVDMECRLKQVETILDKFFSVDISWKSEPTKGVSTTSPTTTSTATTSPTTTSTTTTLPTTASLTSRPTTTSTPKCPENWISFQQSCYLFIGNLVDFNSAAEQCKSLSAHLVYVESSEENTFLKDLIINNGTASFWWIGLTDNEREGTWKWAETDRVATFTSWAEYQPDNQGGNENCVAYTWWGKFNWNDAPCSLKYNFICEKKQF